MGIKGLNAFLKKKCNNVFVNLPYSCFKGKRVAWDSDNIFMKLMARAHKEVVHNTDVSNQELNRDEIVKTWIKYCRDDISKWLQFGITPIFIFDGKYIDEKSETQMKRRAEKKKRTDKANEIREKIYALDPLERTTDMLKELRNAMQYLASIKQDEKEMLMGILDAAGLPVNIATGEGEKLCAMLCIEGKVDAVYTRDTDVVAMGCPLTINEEAGFAFNPNNNKTEQVLKCTIFKPILADLELEYKSFLDLCIMSGCDFNVNIPGCAVTGAYKFLKDYKLVEDIPENKLLGYFNHEKLRKRLRKKTVEEVPEIYKNVKKIEDIYETILNHERCREILCMEKSDEICQDCLRIDVDRDLMTARDKLEIYDQSDWLEELSTLYRYLPQPSNVFVMKKPCHRKSRLVLNVLGKDEEKKSPTFLAIPIEQVSPKNIRPQNTKALIQKQLENLRMAKTVE